MINKLLINIVYALAILGLSGAATADLPKSQATQVAEQTVINQSMPEQKTADPSEFSAFEFSASPAIETQSSKPIQGQSNRIEIDTELFEWTPHDWYGTY